MAMTPLLHLDVILLKAVVCKFTVNGIARAAGAISVGITALNDKVFYHPMERKPRS